MSYKLSLRNRFLSQFSCFCGIVVASMMILSSFSYRYTCLIHFRQWFDIKMMYLWLLQGFDITYNNSISEMFHWVLLLSAFTGSRVVWSLLLPHEMKDLIKFWLSGFHRTILKYFLAKHVEWVAALWKLHKKQAWKAPKNANFLDCESITGMLWFSWCKQKSTTSESKCVRAFRKIGCKFDLRYSFWRHL